MGFCYYDFLLLSCVQPNNNTTMSLSFAEVASLWKTEKSKYIKRSSYAVYVLYLNKHLLPWFGPGNVPNSKTVQGFVDECLSKGKTKNTIRGYLLVLNMVLQYSESLGEWHYQKYHVHYPAFERSHKLQVFTVPQQQLLIKYLIDNISFRNLGIIICLNSGLRIGEICGLQWRDLDLATGEIHVRKTVQRIFLSDGEDKEYALSIDTPKTESSARDIPMSRDLIKLVRPLKTLTHEDYYVISNSQTPLEPRYYRNYLRKVLGILVHCNI